MTSPLVRLSDGLKRFVSRRHAARRVYDRRDFEPAHRLDPSVIADDAVAYIVGPNAGTGFLVAPDRLMTNNHVLPDVATAHVSSARLGYRRSSDGATSDGAQIALDAEAYFHTNSTLDYTVVALSIPASQTPLNVRSGARVKVGDDVYIVGHPRGRPLEVVRNDTMVTRIDAPFLGYRADTERQSSGSPVFDTEWRLVGIHHHSGELGRDERGNEGVLMTAIAEDWP